jgi:hypothetical protein
MSKVLSNHTKWVFFAYVDEGAADHGDTRISIAPSNWREIEFTIDDECEPTPLELVSLLNRYEFFEDSYLEFSGELIPDEIKKKLENCLILQYDEEYEKYFTEDWK